MKTHKIKVIASNKCGLCKIQKQIAKDEKLDERFDYINPDSKRGQDLIEKAKKKGQKIEGKPTFYDDKIGLNETGLKGPDSLKKLVKRVDKQRNKKTTKKNKKK